MSENQSGGKLWALLFTTVPVGALAVSWYALKDWWLPANNSTYGHDVDHLFYLILWVTGLTFVGTQALLCYTLFATRKEGKAWYSHGNHTLEVVWTIIPAALLVFLALYQKSAWDGIKVDMPAKPDVEVKVVAQQFKWGVIYPGRNGTLDTKTGAHTAAYASKQTLQGDDFQDGKLYVPVGKKVLVHLTSADVLHSFFLPQLRTKQDAVPGMSIPVWFQAEKTTAEYAKEYKVREQLLENLLHREGVELTENQWTNLVELVYTGDPYTKEGRAAYKAKESKVKNLFADELWERLQAATNALGKPAGIDQAWRWTFELACAELCGITHFDMASNLVVLTEDEYQAWLEGKMQ